MKGQINPVVAAVVLVVVLAAVGFYFYKKTDYTVRKSDAGKGFEFKVPGAVQQTNP